jgi:predicted KAP-like P-loop ATPase
MSEYFNDSPIERAEDDRYGITPFAKALARSIRTIASPIGTAIAINGEWGSGKSSAVNLIRNELSGAHDPNLEIVDFRCWWFRGEEALTLAFLQELNSTLQRSLGDKVKHLIPGIGRQILQAGPVIGTAVSLAATGGWSALVAPAAAFAKRFFPDQEPLEKQFRKLSEALQKQPKRFLIIIDDIDRLTPDEAITVFRLVKSVGRLPNLIYLLVFDRSLADKAAEERYPSEGPHFLEKIIQASFELPTPNPTDLHKAVLAAFESICGSPPEKLVVRFMNVFYDVVAPYITTPRHVTRLMSAISVTWPAVKDEVNQADFIALETLRLYEPELYRSIRAKRDLLTGSARESNRDESRFDPFLRSIRHEKHSQVKDALQRLFPSLENMGYGGEWHSTWDAERRVCIGKHFDTYFQLALSSEALSTADLNEIIAKAGDVEFIQARLKEAAETTRKTGQSMIPVVLDELTTHAEEVPKEEVEPLLRSIFGIADEITLNQDNDRGFATSSTRLRLHWLIRALTKRRFNLDERTELYLAATEQAGFNWLIDFVWSAVDDYKPDKREPEDNCLVAESALPELRTRALEALRAKASSGQLLLGPNLARNLYCWLNLSSDDGAELRAFVDAQLKDDLSVVRLAKAFTGESWSMGMGMFGLGDRVSKRSVTASLSDDNGIVDTAEFRLALDRVASSQTVSQEDHEIVRVFLEAWGRGRREEDV